MQDELLALMVKFELCYELDNKKGHYLIPQLLPGSRPETYHWDNENNLQLRYHYDFMPKGLLSRLMVRLHHYIKEIDKAWKSGVNFDRDGDTFAEVIETYAKNEITIRVRGSHRKELITIIAEEIDQINSLYEGIRVRKMIPCNCSVCITNTTPHFFKLEQIKKRKTKGRFNIECDESLEDVNITSLIEDVFIIDREDQFIEKRIAELQETVTNRLDIIHKDVIQTKNLLSFALTDSKKIKLPYLFTLRPPDYELAHNQSWVSTTYELQFYCMQPKKIHSHGEKITIKVSKEWVAKIAPYSNTILNVLKGVSHLFLPGVFNSIGLDTYKEIKPNLEGMRDTIRAAQEIKTATNLRQYDLQEVSERSMELLAEALQGKNWVCPLQKKVHKGKVIWVCEKHLKEGIDE